MTYERKKFFSNCSFPLETTEEKNEEIGSFF